MTRQPPKPPPLKRLPNTPGSSRAIPCSAISHSLPLSYRVIELVHEAFISSPKKRQSP